MLIDLYKLSFQLMLKYICSPYISVGRGRHAARLRSLNSDLLSKLEEAKVLLLAKTYL